jgi:hypothetical protein
MDDLICGVCGQDEGEHAHVPLYDGQIEDGPIVVGVYTDDNTFEVCVERWLATERPRTAVDALLSSHLEDAYRWIVAACAENPGLMPPAWVVNLRDKEPEAARP